MSRLFIGVDPGEAHVGFAILFLKQKQKHRIWTLNMGVRDVEHNGFYQIIDSIGDFPQVSNMSVEMIIESYQQRPVGHQAFNTPLTPQFIGALRYVSYVQEAESYLIPPGPPDDLDRLFFTPIIEQWDPPQRKHKHWKHALSALRVIGVHLMGTEPERVMDLQNAFDIGLPLDFDFDEIQLACDNDLSTTPVVWRTPR